MTENGPASLTYFVSSTRIAICGGVLLEEALNLSSDRLLEDDLYSAQDSAECSCNRVITLTTFKDHLEESDLCRI